ncbi:MAG TPA: sulfite oxidase [Chloroflexaceae bacterium]|nr:sulfite oxidase [Chloroflexaceae bacterium]
MSHAAPPAEQLAALGKDSAMLAVTAAPPNLETPLALLDAPLTPADRIFMRNHGPLPEVDPAAWSLAIGGVVRRPLRVGYADLLAMPRRAVTAVLECSGNGRSAFGRDDLPPEELRWGQGAVACGEWAGAPLGPLLEAAGIEPGAVQAECVGAGDAPFARGVEVDKLLADGLLAYSLNGEPLPAAHGGPVRLVVPGWGGVSWVKWVTAITVLDRESASPFNQERYVLYDRAGVPFGKVRALQVKSVIVAPCAGQALRPGRAELWGWAWSAGHGVARVAASADGGATWGEAALGPDMGPYAWRRFSYAWRAAPGRHALLARAVDGRGAAQPDEAVWNQRGYINNALHRVEVTVE